MESTSNPSSAFNAMVMTMTMICRVVIGDLAISSRGSAVLSPMDIGLSLSLNCW